MDIIEQESEILVYHRVGHNIDDPFAIAVYKGTTVRLKLGHIGSRRASASFSKIFIFTLLKY